MTAPDVHAPTGACAVAPTRPPAPPTSTSRSPAWSRIRLLGVRPGRPGRGRAPVRRRATRSAPARPTSPSATCDRLDLDDRSVLRYLGPGLGRVHRRGLRDPARPVPLARSGCCFPGADVGGPCELRCEHGVGRVPHLVALVNLAVLARGGVALHASAFARDGSATVATGWSKGGKTEALLAACDAGRHLRRRRVDPHQV